MYKEEAERLAEQMRADNPLLDVLDIRLDPQSGGYVVVAYDNSTDEKITIESPEVWTEIIEQGEEKESLDVSVRIQKKKGQRVAVVKGKWDRVEDAKWPDEICAAVKAANPLGINLPDLDPKIQPEDLVEPGHGLAGDYWIMGDYLLLLSGEKTRVWRRAIRLANFTLEDQADFLHEWRGLGFDIDPRPRAPMFEPGSPDWDEQGLLEEVKQRLFDVSNEGFDGILIDGHTNTTAYAWLVAGVLGLRSFLGWTSKSGSEESGSTSLGYIELLNYKDVESSI